MVKDGEDWHGFQTVFNPGVAPLSAYEAKIFPT